MNRLLSPVTESQIALASLQKVLSTLMVLLFSVGLVSGVGAQSGDSKTHAPTGLVIAEFGANDTPDQITSVFLGEGLQAQTNSVQINDQATPSTASFPAFGRFSNGLSALGIDSGLVITANAKSSVFAGPLVVNGEVTEFEDGWVVDPDRAGERDLVLEAVLSTGDETRNATSLQFDVIPTERYLKFEYVLAIAEGGHFTSGEWSDNSSFGNVGDDVGVLNLIDGFGLFVDDLDATGNIAVVPGTSSALSIPDSGIVPLAGSTTDRIANRNAGLQNLSEWQADPDNVTIGLGKEIAYYAGADYPDQDYFDQFILASYLSPDVDPNFSIDWAIQFLTVPLTAVHDICEDVGGGQACTDLLASEDPVTVRIAIADAFDTFNPPAVFFAANSVRFEDNPSAEPSAARVTLSQPADIDVGGARATYTATLRDSVGNPINAASNLTLNLSTAPTGGVFYDQLADGSTITQVDIPQGSATATFYFTANTAASYTVIASSSDYPDGRDAIIVEASASSTDVGDAITVLTSFGPTTQDPPTTDDYETIGVVIDAADVPPINTIIKGLDADERDTALKIQAIVDVYGDIKDNADGDPSNEPGLSAAQIKLVGLPTGEAPFTADQADLYNELLGSRQPTDVDTFEELKALSDVVIKVFGTRDDAAYSPGMTADDFEVLGITGVNEDNLPIVIKSLGPEGSGLEDASSISNIQARVDRGITEYSTNIAAINARFSDNTNPAPNATTYNNIGVTGIASGVVAGYINDILQSLYDQEAQSFTRIGIQSVVDLYNDIQTTANGNPATTPGFDADDFSTLGLTDIKTPQQASLANSVLGGAGSGEADTLAEIRALTDISQAIIALAGGAPANTVSAADLTTIGVTGVTSANEAAVLAAIAKTPNNGAAVNTIAKIQTIVDSLATPPTETEINVIITFDPDVDSNPAPTDYEDAGVFGVDPDNVTEINEIIGELVGTPNDEPLTPDDVQDAVNTYIEIQTFADGDSDNDPTLTAKDYQAMGLTQITTKAGADLLNDILGGKQPGDVDTFAKIKAFAEIVTKLIDVAGGGESTLTTSDFTGIGVTGVDTNDDVNTVIAAIAASPDSGSGVSTVAKLQSLADVALTTPSAGDINVIVDFDPATDPDPTEDKYKDAGIYGVDEDNVDGVNEILEELIGLSPGNEPLDPDEVQDAVNAFVEIQTFADGDPKNPPTLEADDYQAMGLPTITTKAGADLLNDILGGKQPGDVDTFAKIKAFAAIVTKIMAIAAGGDETISLADLTAIGITGVTNENLDEVIAAIAATPSNGSSVNNTTKLQAVIDAVVSPPEQSVIDVIITFDPIADPDAEAPAPDDYQGAGVFGVDEDNVDEINKIIGEVVAGTPNDEPLTPADIQDAVNAFIEIQFFADGDPENPPTLEADDYKAMGLPTITTKEGADLLNDILGGQDPEGVDTFAKIKAFAEIVTKIMTIAAGGDETITLADLTAIGITGVNNTTLPAVEKAIADSPKDGSRVNSLDKIQAIVTIVTATPDEEAVTELVNFDPTSDDPAPAPKTYEDAGIVGVDANNVTPINDLIGNIPSEEPLSPADIQAIVNAYNEVLTAANGDKTKTGQLTKEQFAVLGLGEVDEVGETTLLNDIIGSSDPTDVNTYEALKKLADIVVNIIGTAGGSGGDELTASDFTDIGVIGVDEDNVGEVIDAIGETPDDGTRVDSLDEIQEIVDAVTTEVPDTTVETFVDSTNKDVGGYGNAGVAGVDADNLTTINTWVDESDNTDTGTQAGLQKLVNAVNAVLAGTGSDDGRPASVSLAQFETLGLDEIDTTEKQDLMNGVIGRLPASPQPTPAQLAEIADAVVKANALATGTSTTKLTAGDLATLGLTASTADAVALFNAIIAGQGTTLTTDAAALAKADAAVVALMAAADGSAGTQATLDQSDYASLGIAVGSELAADFLNAVLGRADGGLTTVASIAGPAAIANRVVTQINAEAGATTLSVADFSGIGIAGVSAANVALVNERIAETTAATYEGSDPITVLQGLVTQAISDYADQPVPVPTLSVWALWLMMVMMLALSFKAIRD